MLKPRKVYNFLSANGRCPVEDFIHQQDVKTQNKIRIQLNQLQMPQCQLQPPTVKAFRLNRYKGLYELRTRIRQMIRIIFYIDENNAIILLHGFIKKHNRATEQALETARARQLALAVGSANYKEIIGG